MAYLLINLLKLYLMTKKVLIRCLITNVIEHEGYKKSKKSPLSEGDKQL